MKARPSLTFLLAAALAGCGGQRVPATDHHLPAAVATPPNDAALLRVARTSGTAQLLRPNSLISRDAIIPSGLPAISRILGTTGGFDQIVYASDNGGRLVAIDLKSQRSRAFNTPARQFIPTYDGTIIGLDSMRRPIHFSGTVGTVSKVTLEKGALLLRGPGDQMLVFGNKPGTLQVVGAAGEIRHLPVPNGRVTATWVGDLAAVVTDSGVVFVDPSPTGKPIPRKTPPKFLKVKGTPIVGAFSPSGHRLYVTRKTGGMVMVDRFGHTVMRDLPAVGAADGLRADRGGRWLLAHASAGDSLWVIDLSRWTVAWKGVAPWADDLPQVVSGQTLLVRRKADVLAIDLTGSETTEKATLAGGAGDLYIMLPWVPKAGSPVASEAVAATPAPAQSAAPPTATASAPDSAAAPPSNPGAPGSASKAPAAPSNGPTGGKLYVQVSASQNQEWAKALAQQLKDGGFPASVLDPKTADESYRVVIGPYLTREDADAVGKRLGRPYFIITPSSGDT